MSARITCWLLMVVLLGCGAHPPAREGGDASADDVIHWGYSASDGPAQWMSLREDWRLCGEGRSQSPIALRVKDAVAPAEALDFDYKPSSLRISRNAYVVEALNNGHTIQVNVDEDSDLAIGAKRYRLLQYHYHAPSEHAVNGRHYPMEIHLVHQSEAGEIAVVGIFVEEGEENPALLDVLDHLPEEHEGPVHRENVEQHPKKLIPERHRWFRYAGSLTTPPCTEDVRWFVIESPIQASRSQIDAFTALYSGNARPIQERHDRSVVYEAFE